MTKNARIVLKKYTAQVEAPTEDNFAYEECPFPDQLGDGQVLIKNLYLSVDPTLRFSMNETNVPFYLIPWRVGQVVYGIMGLGVVEKSTSEQYVAGDFVIMDMQWPWQLFFVQGAKDIRKINVDLVPNGKITYWLSVFGIVGMTAITGIHEKAHIVQGTNQTFVVSGAAGGTGSLAGQIARLEGCGKVVGICGSDEKCKFLTDELKFDVAINYKTQDVASQLKKACPNGVDIYFDNVGGEISRSVVEQMNPNGHIVLCGQISQYDKGMIPPFTATPPEIKDTIQAKNITRDVFYVFNYKDTYPECIQLMAKWLQEGKLIVQECIEEGLKNAPKGFLKMMNGQNIGKQLIHVEVPYSTSL